MNKKILILSLMALVLFTACSDIDYLDRKIFCEDRDMKYVEEYSGGWKCKINDLDYVRLDCCNEVEDTIPEKKYSIPKCAEWCNINNEYNQELCAHNCELLD